MSLPGPSLRVVPLRSPGLVERAVAGEAQALEALLRTEALHVARYVTNLLGRDDPELDDVAQLALTDLARGISQLKDPVAFVGWVRALVVARVHQVLRSRRRRSWLVFGEATEASERLEAPDASDEVREGVRLLYRLLGQRSPEERLIFALRYVEGLAIREVAAAIGKSEATCKRRLADVEQFLRSSAAGTALERFLTNRGAA